MKRIALFEFEDQPWLPSVVRAGVTRLISVFHRLTGTARLLARYLREAREKQPFDRIVDLGSGSGGPLPDAVRRLRGDGAADLEVLLTDLHPDPKTVQRFNGQDETWLRYHPEPADATDLSAAPAGLKTMIGSFHHLGPEAAGRLLRSAQTNRQPILIYELATNNIPLLLWWLLLPISLLILIVMSMAMTPFVRPLTLRQLLLTYLLPVIPLVYAWDGQASLVRTYTFDDIKALLGEGPDEGYTWVMDKAGKPGGRRLGYYIMGLPT